MTSLTIIADENIPMVEDYFSPLGNVTLVNGRQLSREQLLHADILLVRSVTPVDHELLDNTPVRFVGTATIGTDHLDISYLNQMGIAWANAPGSNAASVVDYVFSVFASLENVLTDIFADASVGIIGMGNVGSRLYQRLNKLNVNCVAYDPLIDQSQHPILGSLETVLQADIICCHAPFTVDGQYPTKHLLGAENLRLLSKGAVLINAGRGGVIDNQALKNTLKERDDLTAILDVWENEPSIDTELLDLVAIATPHIAGYSLDGKCKGTEMIHDSCCKALGLTHANSTILNNTISVDIDLAKSSDDELIRDAILACYTVRQDDQRFKSALKTCPAENIGLVFDQLRKDYPERREFSSCRITHHSQMSEKVSTSLSCLGFRLTEHAMK